MAVLIKDGMVVQLVGNDHAFDRLRGACCEAGLPRNFRNMIDLMQYKNKTDGGKQHEMRAEQPEY